MTPGVTVTSLALEPGRATALARLARAEWTKMRSLRSTRWSLAALVVAAVGLTTLGSAVLAANWGTLSASQQRSYLANPTGFFGAAISLAVIPLCVLGVLVATSEYSAGTMQTSVLAVPRRARLVLAKAAVFSLVALAVGEAVAFPSLFVAQALLPRAVPVSLTAPGDLRATLGVGLYLWVLGLASFAVGLLLRHTAGALTVVVGLVLVASNLAEQLPGSLGEHVGAFLPADAAKMVMAAHQGTANLLSPWQGFAVGCGWAACLMGAATYFFVNRDV